MVSTIILSVLLAVLIYFSRIVTYIPNSKIGIVEKLWSKAGSVKSGFIALNGEAGFQPEILRGGFHFFMPFQYRVHIESLVTIAQGEIGYVFARDGKPLLSDQTLASNAEVTDFQDAKSFLVNGGQKGPQRLLLREGTHAINVAQFVVITKERIHALKMDKQEAILLDEMKKTINERNGFTPVVILDKDDKIGVVVVHDGPSLSKDQIIAPNVGDNVNNKSTFHNNFQNPEAFLQAGGMRGRQLQVLVEGSYFINRLFATIECIPKTTIEIGMVGVVVSYTGEKGLDVSGDSYRHGELVEQGQRGVWRVPLMPGKYAFNTYAGKIVRLFGLSCGNLK